MILYHGSNQLINSIDLSKSKDFKDFGRGFSPQIGNGQL